MSATFASPEWADSLAAHLREDAQLRDDASTWVYGPITLVVDGAEQHGFDAAAMRLDLHAGEVAGVTTTSPSDAQLAPFELVGSLAHWRAVLGGAPTVMDAVLQSKLQVRGDLPTLARHSSLLDGIARSASAIETVWPDEQTEA